MAGYLRTQAVSCYPILNAVLIPKYFDISLLSKNVILLEKKFSSCRKPARFFRKYDSNALAFVT